MTRRKALSITAILTRKQKTTQKYIEAQGRLREREPVAILDIGSNSVRLVIYEGLTRSLQFYLTRRYYVVWARVAQTGTLDEKAVKRALTAIKRFYQLSSQIGVKDLHILATAAAREAENGPKFIKQVETICSAKVQLLTGSMEAYYAGLGADSGFYKPDGIVGDLGGGSMELTPTSDDAKQGVTTPLGGIRLQESSKGDISQAAKIARKELSNVKLKWPNKSKCFYAIGGTWRNLARLHMFDVGYP